MRTKKSERYDMECRIALGIWKNNNPEKNINDMKQKEKVTINEGTEEEKLVTLGSRISVIKQILRGTRKEKLTEEEIKFWVEQEGISTETLKQKQEKEFRQALEIWKSDHPGKNVNDVPEMEVVTINKGLTNEKRINLGSRISNIKQILKGNIIGNLTEEQIFYWINQEGLTIENKKEILYKQNEKNYREALKVWKNDHPGETVNDIQKDDIVTIYKNTINERKIKLGARIVRIKKILNGKILGNLTEEEIEFWVKKEGLILKDRRYKEYINKEKNRKRQYRITTLLKEFNIDIDMLDFYLGKIGNLNSEKQVNVTRGMTLKKYCREKEYDFDTIYRLIQLNRIYKYDNLEDLIVKGRELSIENNLKKWIYEKYGATIEVNLHYLGLKQDRIIEDMAKNILSIEEAIQREIFIEYIENKKNSNIEKAYDALIDECNKNKQTKDIEQILANTFYSVVRKYELKQEEYKELKNILYKYIETLKRYRIVDIGLEEVKEEQINKMIKYNLDAYDIEEALLINLDFQNKEQSDVDKKRQLLKSYIIDWNEYSDFEKQAVIRENAFSEEIVDFMMKKREEIDRVINFIMEEKKRKEEDCKVVVKVS